MVLVRPSTVASRPAIGKAGFLLGLILAAGLIILGGCKSGTAGSPAPMQSELAYVANQSGSLSGYALDASSGALTTLAGFPIASGVNPIFIIHDPQHRFAIVADVAANVVRVFAINSSTGMLTEIPPSPYAVGSEPRALAIDPSGTFVYFASQALNSVAAFSLDAAGKLTPVPGSPFPTGGKTGFGCCVVVHPTGKFLYVEDTANVYAFAIDTSTGALTLTNTVSGPKQGSGLALDPAGSLLYAVGAGSNSVETFTVNSTTGAISLFGTSPLSLQNGGYAILVHPSGRFAYTVEGGQMLVAYSLQGGVLTSLAKYSGALGSQQLAIDASDTFLYAPQTGTANSISGFRIEALGTLTPLPGSPTVSGRTPVSITITSR